jgi:hypothetical protein
MNWRAWIWGAIVSVLSGAYTGFTAWVEIPNPSDIQIIKIMVPALAGPFITFLMKSPFPGATGITLPPEVKTQ